MKKNIKEQGQVYTPDQMVSTILDEVGFTGESILGKTILEPSSGDGAFLVEIARRIIAVSNSDDLVNNLLCMQGWEIDPIGVARSIERLNELVAHLGIDINWQVFERDSLQYDPKQEFDFVVGNPPYVRIHNLPKETKVLIQDQFEFCKNGMVDLYYAFFELAVDVLKPGGKCAYITPNSYFYNQAARNLRDHLIKNGLVHKIINYCDMQIFPNIGTYCAVTIFGDNTSDLFRYCKIEDGKEVFRDIPFAEIELKKTWRLSIDETESCEGVPLRELCSIHTGIATLADSVFIFPTSPIDKDHVTAKTKQGEYKIEKSILKPIIKASTIKSSNDPIKFNVIFPYKKELDKWIPFTEDELKTKFPMAYFYLEKQRDKLEARDKGKCDSYRWYEFGRTQGLNTSFGKKILFSPINMKPNFVLIEEEDSTFYSGYCIKYEGDANKLLRELNSKKMERYISNGQRDFQKGWKSYTKKGIENFPVIIDG